MRCRRHFGIETMKDYGVILFYTTSAAMRTEKILKKSDIPIKLIPTPRELSSDCGIALRFNWDNAERVKTLLKSGHVEFEAIHQL